MSKEQQLGTYAAMYVNKSNCEFKKPIVESLVFSNNNEVNKKDKWQSPSDLFIGRVKLKPPFTSKITRGKTHEGILVNGDSVLATERKKFLIQLNELVQDNDAAWFNILEIEQKYIEEKVKLIYSDIFKSKSEIMSQEMTKFYESTLQELEDHVRREIQTVLLSVHANIISDLNFKIKSMLNKEKETLQIILKNKYENEIQNVKKYYELLLNSELHRNNKIINRAIYERNDALKCYIGQIEAENITSTMYVMCTERKKCKIKQIMLENYQMTEISKKKQKMKERQDVLNEYMEKEVHNNILEINKEWEDKIIKVLKLFLKFMCYSLKLLPEQCMFLLDFEKLVVLQLNEIQKTKNRSCSILIDDKIIDNTFQFEVLDTTTTPCMNEPFLVNGDISETPVPQYNSTETLPSDIDLPLIRLNRQFIYAKCHNYEEIKALLKSEQCKCSNKTSKISSNIFLPNIKSDSLTPKSSHASLISQVTKSSNESIIIDNTDRLGDCPVRQCKNWDNRILLPYLDSYFDYTDENYKRLIQNLNMTPKEEIKPKYQNPKDIVLRKLPFAATEELYQNVSTQYSSQESLYMSNTDCPCIRCTDRYETKSPENLWNEILMKRKTSLRQLLQENPKLLKIFTNE